MGGKAGYHVLVPFVTEPTDGSDPVVMVVDRGFVPLGADASARTRFPTLPQDGSR
ncbi:SURF1 family cytochrome oxidase biogenesis protein [Oerskovia sp. M15]